MFLLPFNNCKTLFFIKVYNYSEGFSNRHVVTLFQTNVLKKARILRYLHNHNLDTKFPKQIYRILSLLNSLNKCLFYIFLINETQNLSESVLLTNMCQNRIFIILLVFHVFIKKNCFYKVRTKSQMARLHLYRQWFYKCYSSKSYNYLNMT